jgi:outer membrane protein W
MKKLFLFLLAGICIQTTFAQHSSFTIAYPIAFPMSDLKSYISNVSFRGISFEYERRVKQNVSVGLETGWQVFYQKENLKTYTDGTVSVSGVQYRYTNTVPIILGARYYKHESNGKVTPFAGIGLGTLYVERATDFGIYRFTKDAWQFCVRPELGIMYQVHEGMDIMVAAKYYAAFNANDLNGQPYLSVNIGFVFHGH